MQLPAKTVIDRRLMMKKSAIAYKAGSSTTKGLGQPGLLAAAFCIVAIGMGPPNVVGAEPQHGAIAITCTNPYSGASWQIKIDYNQHTVDANPAEIDEATISWRDAANGWRYALDRKSGKLTVTVASATGGNFLYDSCKLEN